MYVITFYSFKGGVGRTMALVNVGAELARRGRKVLLVDFDLEAPGLSTYDVLRSGKPHPGIVEYVSEFRRTRQSPLVTDFLYASGPIGKKDGKVWVMPAGRGDGEYRRLLNALNWRTLYQDEEGFLLFEDTRAQWEAELHPDYVLIDARTGHTDIEGICTRQLPQTVVILFHPNEQNLAGLREVCHDIREESSRGLKKVIKLHFVASNVPDLDDEDRYLRRRMSQFREELETWHGPDLMLHRNETLQMLEQPIFVLKRPHSRLAREYRTLVRMLQIENLEDRDGALFLLKESRKQPTPLHSDGHFDRAPGLPDRTNVIASGLSFRSWVRQLVSKHEPFEKWLHKITHEFWNDPEVLFWVGACLLRRKEMAKALDRLTRVAELRPDFADGGALYLRAHCHLALGDKVAAANELLRYLRDHGAGTSEELELERLERNEHALERLLSISLDDFLKTFDLPRVAVFPPGPYYLFWLLSKISLRMIQERRWDDAIRVLEHPKINALIESESRVIPTCKSLHGFHLAIAHWGRAGAPPRQTCAHAILAYEGIPEYVPTSPEGLYEPGYDPYYGDPFGEPSYFGCNFNWFQDLSLLYWGAGDAQKATAALDRALAIPDPAREEDILDQELADVYQKLGIARTEEMPSSPISSWTFRGTTWCQFRIGCEEMGRMIRGEAIRPPFLGPPR